jgi:hypothetical protein
MLDRLDKL